MRIGDLEFRDKQGNEIEPTKQQMAVVIADLQKKLDQANEKINEHNEYFKAFNCKDFKEFQDFISSFMLTPHEEQTLIKDLQNQLNQANERLKGAIVPKFKIGQKLFRINYDYESNEYDISEFNISNYVIFYNDKLWGYPKGYLLDDEDLFATKEEAEKKLQKLKNDTFQGE